jgi:hypothetical protein
VDPDEIAPVEIPSAYSNPGRRRRPGSPANRDLDGLGCAGKALVPEGRGEPGHLDGPAAGRRSEPVGGPRVRRPAGGRLAERDEAVLAGEQVLKETGASAQDGRAGVPEKPDPRTWLRS